jgi:Tannase and feruloyl esterase
MSTGRCPGRIFVSCCGSQGRGWIPLKNTPLLFAASHINRRMFGSGCAGLGRRDWPGTYAKSALCDPNALARFGPHAIDWLGTNRTLIASLIGAALSLGIGIWALVRNRTLIAFLVIASGITVSGIVAALGHGQRSGRRAASQGPPPAEPALGSTPKPAIPDAKPVRSCESLAMISLPNTTIESSAVDPANLGLCRVTAITTHPPSGDKIRIWIGIPTASWNGRFLGVGGVAFTGGNAEFVNQPVALGYASASTDTGHEWRRGGSFALDANGRLNWQLIRDNAYVGIHEMTVTGKALTQAMYGAAPRYSYFNGCSTGGRQGLMEAQRYPQDYNGIVSGAPAINWTRFLPQDLWGGVMLHAAAHSIPACKLAAATAAAIAACDAIDGVKDGVIEDPKRCNYDPQPLVGTSAGNCGTFTETDVDLIRKFWEGPRRQDGSFLWYGQPRGADLNETLKPQVSDIAQDWFRYFLAQDPKLNWTTITPAAYERYFDQSVEEFGAVIGTDNPDLTAFRDRGGKAILWHGWADPVITPEGTIDYYTRVQEKMGGAGKTSEFVRLFLAPGVGHCAGGAGPTPYGQLDELLSWVEEGKAPQTLTAARRDQAGAITRSRPLCQYPLVAKYKGTGSTDDAANFVCSTGF